MCKCNILQFANMSASKKGKKQDAFSSDDGFESYVRECLQAIRQDIKDIKNNQGKFKEDLQAVEKKLDRTEKSSSKPWKVRSLRQWLNFFNLGEGTWQAR